MRIENITVNIGGQKIKLSADIIFNDGFLFNVWFEFDKGLYTPTSKNADVFLAVSLLVAMKKGERLSVKDGMISQILLDNTPKIMRILNEWDKSFRIIEIEANCYDRNLCENGNIGCFFSGGVDSFYSVLKNQDLSSRYSDIKAITHLITVQGFDIKLDDSIFFDEVKKHILSIADSIGTKAVFIRTNAREFSKGIVNWEFYHGAVLASVGLSLGSTFPKIYIPSTEPFEHLVPWGSHPDLDPLWSTESTQFIHDGIESSKQQKIEKYVIKSDLAMKYLRVCWQNRGKYNCSECEKCFRTMLRIYVVAQDAPLQTFDKIDYKKLANIIIPNHLLHFWKEILKRLKILPKTEDSIRLIKAVRRVVLNSHIVNTRDSVINEIKKFIKVLYRKNTDNFACRNTSILNNCRTLDSIYRIIFRGSEGGWENIGDQAMFANAIRNLRAKFPNAEITVLTDKKDNTYNCQKVQYESFLYDYLQPKSKILKGMIYFLRLRKVEELSYVLKTIWIIINARLRKHIFLNGKGRNIIELLKSSDFIYLGGGGYLNDLWPHMLYQVVTLSYFGRLFRKPIIMSGQGIGPVRNKWHRWLIRKALNKVHILTFREENSQKYALSLGIEKPLMETVGDDALTLPSEPNEKIKYLIEKTSRPILGVQFRNSNYIRRLENEKFKNLASLLDSLIRDFDLQVLFIPMSYSKNADDANSALKIHSYMINKDRSTLLSDNSGPMEIKYAISRVDYFLGTSYHALLFALSQGVPALGLYSGEYYSLKIKGLFDFFDLKDFVTNLENFSLEEIKDKFYRLIKDDSILRSNLLKKTQNMTLNLENMFSKISNHISKNVSF